MKNCSFESLYIHVPFCRNICDYCALYSVVENSPQVRIDYLKKIRMDLEKNRQNLKELKTIFIGGGTPTALRPDELRELLMGISEFSSNVLEFSVECNPSTVDDEKFIILKEFGVNRLSFGGQSTSRKTRKSLGRRTGDRELFAALEMAQKHGFDNFNVDMIYAVPGQSLADWQYDLGRVLEFGVRHFSAYSLILEEGTVLSEKYDETDDDLAVEMYNLCEEALDEHGLKRYEVSNYALPGDECKHNLGIWHGAKYLGIGPAAASFDGVDRWTEKADLMMWLEGAKAEIDQINQLERLAEVIAFGFRTVEGWQKERLQSLYGSDILDRFSRVLERLKKLGLLEENESTWKPTVQGLLFADEVALALIEEAMEEKGMNR